jgi:hypothetical protein
VDYLGQVAMRAAVLPARAVYLISDGSRSGLRRAVQEACTRWGGMTEPIVPVPPGGQIADWWLQVAALSGANNAVNVDVPDDDAADAARQLGVDLIPLAQIDRAGTVMFSTHPGNIGFAAPTSQNDWMACEDGHLWEVVAAGDLTPEHIAAVQPTPDLVQPVRPRTDDQVARAQVHRDTLLDRTVVQFAENTTRGGPSSFPAIVWVTAPDDLEECLFFWNLRALRPLRYSTVPMILLPVGQVQHWLYFPRQLASVLERPDEFTPDVALCSLNVDASVLDETAGLLDLHLSEEKIRSGHRYPTPPLRQAPFTYRTGIDVRHWLVYERSYGQPADIDAHLFKDITTVRFTSPVSFRGAGAVLVHLSGAPFDALPERPSVARLVTTGAIWNGGSIQLHTTAMDEYRFELHVPDLPEAVKVMLAEVSSGHALSDKGQLGTALQHSSDIAALLEPGIYEAISELRTPRTKELYRELKDLRAAGAVDEDLVSLAEQWGGRRERRYLSIDKIHRVDRAIAPQVMERLCELGWAERGLELHCPACGIRSLVAFADTTGQGSCNSCGTAARYTTGTALTVYYRLNSIIDRAADQGVVPHLLTIAHLTQQHAQSWFLPGANVDFGDGRPAEVDIFGVHRRQVLSGEVKAQAADFTHDQIDRDVELSKRLGADVHLLAAVDDIPRQTELYAQKRCEARGITLVVLGPAELRPATQ